MAALPQLLVSECAPLEVLSLKVSYFIPNLNHFKVIFFIKAPQIELFVITYDRIFISRCSISPIVTEKASPYAGDAFMITHEKMITSAAL